MEVSAERGIERIPSGSLAVFMPDMRCKTRAAAPGAMMTNSVAMEIENMEFTRIHEDELTPELIDGLLHGKDDLLLPFTMPLDNSNLDITCIIQKIISEYMKNDAAGFYRCLSLWFALTAAIHSEFVNRLFLSRHSQHIPSSCFYVKKAKKYISENYCGRFRIDKMAAELGVTPNYLSQMFKAETGRTILEYVNILRAQKVRELAFDGNGTLAQIAEQVGLQDVRYLQKMFKKNFGISIQECRRIDRELSLYHVKPWSVDHLSRDLMVNPHDRQLR